MFWACFVNTGIYLYTLRGRTPDLAMLWPRSPPALYVLHVRVLVTRDRAATGTERWQLRCQLLCHCMLGQDRDSSVTGPSLVTISSQLVREPIIITRSLSSSSWPRRPEVGRLIRTPHTHSEPPSLAGPLSNLRLELRCQILYQSVLSNFAETSDR